MEIVAIIPARGGSKGIPRKNLEKLCGIPLVAIPIIEARKSKYITKIVVSTDDPDIAVVCENYGANVIFRPSEISGDTASSESALIHALYTLKTNFAYEPFLTVFLQCTSPLTMVEDIDNTIKKLIDESADCAFTVSDFHYFIWENDEDGNAIGVNHDKRFRHRRQDRKPQFLETGSVYVMKTRLFLKNKHRFFGKTVMNFLPAERKIEIDDHFDLEIARILMRKKQYQFIYNFLPSKIDAVFFDYNFVYLDTAAFFSDSYNYFINFDKSDNIGLSILKSKDISLFILSLKTNGELSRKSDKLGIKVFETLSSKFEKLNEIVENNKFNLKNCIYIGYDSNDIECMSAVGVAFSVNNANEEVKKHAHFVLKEYGGEGAIREFTEIIFNKSGVINEGN